MAVITTRCFFGERCGSCGTDRLDLLALDLLALDLLALALAFLTAQCSSLGSTYLVRRASNPSASAMAVAHA